MRKNENYNNIVEQLINNKSDDIKEYSVILNNDKPNFKKKDYKIIEGEPKYFEPDEYGRSNGAIALVSKNTIPLVIKKNNVKILYKVTIKYKNNNQIPTGVLIEAQSIDDNFSICRFCYNIEKNIKFNYCDGTIIKDSRLLDKIKERAIRLNTSKKNRKKI